jgi:hypothetical protein
MTVDTFRGFWHGPPLSPYELLCMRSVVAQGSRFELFTYDPAILVPEWVCRRDAREILPTDHVMVYRTGRGVGSPALHSDLFRYEMLEHFSIRLGVARVCEISFAFVLGNLFEKRGDCSPKLVNGARLHFA